jgi:hypothetical protein
MCLSEFIDLRYSQSSWYFRPSSVICCPYITSLVQVSTHTTHTTPRPEKLYLVMAADPCFLLAGGVSKFYAARFDHCPIHHMYKQPPYMLGISNTRAARLMPPKLYSKYDYPTL